MIRLMVHYLPANLPTTDTVTHSGTFSHRNISSDLIKRDQDESWMMFWSDWQSYLLVTLNFNDPLESLWQVIWLFGRQRKVVLIWDNFKRLFALKFVHIWLLNLGWHERMSRPAKTGLFERGLTENKCEIDLHRQIEIGSWGVRWLRPR